MPEAVSSETPPVTQGTLKVRRKSKHEISTEVNNQKLFSAYLRMPMQYCWQRFPPACSLDADGMPLYQGT